MGRLIDADEFIIRVEEKLKTAKEQQTRIVLSLMIGIIAEQPTAYDVEKIIKNLRLTCYAMGLEEHEADVLVRVVEKGGVK